MVRSVRILCFVGNGLHERYYYCINIAYISVILWGYVIIWYSCGNNRAFVPQITRQCHQREGGIWRRR